MPSPKKEAPPPDSNAEKKARNLAAERSQKVIYKNPVFEQKFNFDVSPPRIANCRRMTTRLGPNASRPH